MNSGAERMGGSDLYLCGPWLVDSGLLYDHDGGHGMIFKDFSDRYWLTLHYPNTFGKEHPTFIALKYQNGRFEIQTEYPESVQFCFV